MDENAVFTSTDHCISDRRASDHPAGMTFGDAVKALKEGFRLSRYGWNGKGQWVFLTHGSRVQHDNIANPAVRDNTVGDMNIRAHLDMHTAQGDFQIGWLASQSDMLAADWYIVK